MIALKLAGRELKNNKKYWIFFTANLCIGLLGFTFIYFFRSNITNALEGRARTLLSSDLAVFGRRVLVGKEKQKVDDYLKNKILQETTLRELYSMAKLEKDELSRSRLVFIKSVKNIYPLIGEIRLSGGELFDKELIAKLQKNPFVVISPEIAHQFRIDLGDKFWLGSQEFKVYGIIKTDSTSSLRGLSLAPKVYIGDAFLEKTNLLAFGTLAFYSHYYLLKKNIDIQKTKTELFKMIADPAIKVQTPKNSSERLGRVVNYLSDYLGLIGVVALLISCVGASYLFQSYLFDRLKQIGILKSLGVPKKDIMGSFTLLILFLGVLATIIALISSKLLMPIAMFYFKSWISFEVHTLLNLKMVLTMLSIGVLVNLSLSLPILQKVFKSKTIFLLNGEVEKKSSYIDYLMYLPGVILLWGLSVWQANSFFVGSAFFLAILFSFLFILMVLPFCLRRISKWLLTKKMTTPISLSFGYALRIVSRNELATLLIILCLSIGISLISVIGQLDKSLRNELTGDTSNKPSLFLFDLQEEQKEKFLTLTKESNIPISELTPMIRGRLLKKNGELIKRKRKKEGFTSNEAEKERWVNNRGVNLTYSSSLNSAESIIEGRPLRSRFQGVGLPEISLEKRYAKRLGVKIGDTLTYDILGIEIKGQIVNLRSVKWTSFLPNFFIRFQDGVLEEAPKTYLAAIKKVRFERQLDIQDVIVDAFPNISIVNITEIVAKIIKLFTAMGFAVGVMSLCCIGVGVFVLYSILQSQMHKKQRDFAQQKIIGMNEKDIFRIILYEYLIIIVTALVIGTVLGLGLAFLVSYLFLDGILAINYPFLIIFNAGLIFICLVVISIAFKTNYNKNIKELLLN